MRHTSRKTIVNAKQCTLPTQHSFKQEAKPNHCRRYRGENYDIAAQLTSEPLLGRFSIELALERLLRDTGLYGGLTSSGVITISQSGSEYESNQNGKGKSMNITNSTKRKTLLASLIGVFAAGGMTQATAQAGEAATEQSRIDEIVVTASKRGEGSSVQDYSGSITAIGAEAVDRKNLVGMTDYLMFVPGVTMLDLGTGKNQVVMRGVGVSLFEQPTVSTYFGEVPLSNPVAVFTGSTDLKLIDIERVEVLRGPQGTLYGSGAMGGTVRNIPVAPNLNELEGSVNVGFSTMEESDDTSNKVEGVINIPLIEDELALRLVAYHYDNAGYIDSVSSPSLEDVAARSDTTVNLRKDYNSSSYVGGRAALLWEPSEQLSISLTYASQELESNTTDSVVVALGRYEFNENLIEADTTAEDEFRFTNLVIEYDFGWATLLSSSSKLDGSSKSVQTVASSASSNTQFPEKESFTQEVRLSSNLEGDIQFVSGLYYEDYEHNNLLAVRYVGSPETFPDFNRGTDPLWLVRTRDKNLEQKAVFGELVYTLSPKWELIFGGRWYDYDRQDNNNTEGSRFRQTPSILSELPTDEQGSIYKFNASYSPDDDTLLYAEWAQGFRVGEGQALPDKDTCEVNGFLIGTNAPFKDRVDSDSTENFELGGKFTLLDSRLNLNAAIYRIDWDDIPVTITELSDSCESINSIKANGGKARLQGIELETSYHVTPDLRLNFSASYNDSEFLDDSIGGKGDRLPLSARVNANLGIEYHFELASYNAFVRSDYSFVSDYFTNVAGTSPEVGGFGKWNLNAGIEVNQFDISVFGKNLTNQDDLVGGSGRFGWRLQPRVIGLYIGYKF